ncbi:MAG TPA: DinB family protein [Acidimicrobiales bacterium]
MAGSLNAPARADTPKVGTERELVDAWLEWHRATLHRKCHGLDDAKRKARPVPSSSLSLHGLVRHMAEVERSWFTRTLLAAPETPHLYLDGAHDAHFEGATDADWETDLGIWQRECETSRANAARHDLDHVGNRRGTDVSLRWIYLHMIEEYARHNGHADLIREMVDGAVGY